MYLQRFAYPSYLPPLLHFRLANSKLVRKMKNTAKFIASAGVPYIMGITQVSTDVMNSESGFTSQAYLVNVDYNGYKVLEVFNLQLNAGAKLVRFYGRSGRLDLAVPCALEGRGV
jgi:hypothetical protein